MPHLLSRTSGHDFMEQHQPESDVAYLDRMRARWAGLDPAMRRRIVWITTLVVILLIVVAVFVLGAAPQCKKC
jgi:hypothetical protein